MEDDQMLQRLLSKADGGDIEAQYELGWRLAIGVGVPCDDEQAVHWLKSAASAGHPLARNNLGARYLAGEGVPCDLIEAYKWFHLAAEQGDRKAGKNRDTVAAQLTPEQIQQALLRTVGPL